MGSSAEPATVAEAYAGRADSKVATYAMATAAAVLGEVALNPGESHAFRF
ncbi:MAG: hypothetical protein H0U35_02510 [Sporichthyaceae bacterium]|nr:hypothetical protein [Sporichthyaceae bacterium]